MTDGVAAPAAPLALALDRAAPAALSEQIAAGLRSAIAQGRLAPGARLPSWRDLASQLGVARGTVRAAYETLIDAGLVQALGAAGTRVARCVPVRSQDDPPATAVPSPLPGLVRGSGVFQMGVPAQDAIPAKLWSRLFVRAARAAAGAAPDYPDPRGEPALRAQIAAMLAVARGLACSPAQVYVTGGHAASVTLAVQALGLAGQTWTEEPGYPLTRSLLATLGLATVAVPVDAQGLDVAAGQALAPQAALAVVTPGQQAPLGVALAPARRRALLDWAVRQQAWVLEDDYLGELQLQGRAAPALGAGVAAARVLHVGTFSKTISPALRLGFLVVPADQVARFDAATALRGSAPAPLVQQAVAELLQGGHHLRHLRRMKRLYLQRRDALLACLRTAGITHRAAGLAVLLKLPPGRRDVAIVRAAQALGLSPAPLSSWYVRPGPEHNGLLLGVTNLRVDDTAAQWARLQALVGAAL